MYLLPSSSTLDVLRGLGSSFAIAPRTLQAFLGGATREGRGGEGRGGFQCSYLIWDLRYALGEVASLPVAS